MSRSTTTRSRRFTALTAATAVLTPTVLGTSVGVAGAATPTNDSYSFSGGGARTLEVLENDAVNNTARIVSVSSPSGGGAASISPNGRSISYTPPAGFFGTETFSYTAEETTGQGQSRTTTTYSANVSVKVTKPTVTQNRSVTVLEGEEVTVDFGSAAAGTLEVTSTPPDGDVTVSGGTVVFAAFDNVSGPQSFGYRYETSTEVVVGTVAISVLPRGVNDTASTSAGTKVAIPVLDNDEGSINPDAAGLEVASSPANGTAVVSGTSVEYTSLPTFRGTDTFTYRAMDGHGQSFTASVSVQVGAPPKTPRTEDRTVTVREGESVTTSFGTPQNPALPGTLQVTSVPPNADITVDETRSTVTYAAFDNISGPESYTYSFETATELVSGKVVVNVTPTGVDDAATTPADVPVTIPVLENDGGSIDPNTANITVTSAPSSGTVTTPADDSSVPAGSVRYTAREAGFTGRVHFTYQAQDASGQTYTARVTVDVTKARSEKETITRNVSESLNAGSSVITDFNLPSDRVVPGTLRVTSVPGATGPRSGSVTVDATQGTIVYTPRNGFSGPDSYTYRVETASAFYEGTVTLDVNPVGVDDRFQLDGPARVRLEVLNNDLGSINRNSGPRVQVSDGPRHGTISYSSFKNEPSYTPHPGFSGVDTFTYSYSDRNGQPFSAKVTLIVRNGQLPPAVVRNDTLTFDTGTTGSVDVTRNDQNVDPTSLRITEQPRNGTATLSGTTVTVTPTAGFSGTDHLHYQVNDLSGRPFEGTVEITVRPDAVADSFTAGPLPTTLDLFANDAGTLDTATVEVTRSPQHGTLAPGGQGEVVYSPAPGYDGPDSFEYRIVQAPAGTLSARSTTPPGGTIVSLPALVTLDVVGPTVANYSATVGSGSSTTTDVNPTSETVTSLTVTSGPAQGSTTVDAPAGTITYAAPRTYSGPDSYTYRLVLESGKVYVGTVTVDVDPVGVDDAAETVMGVPTSPIPVLGNDNGSIDPFLAGVRIVDEPENGSVSVSGVPRSPLPGSPFFPPSKNQPVYTPDPGFEGVDTFVYEARDSFGQPFSATVSVTVVNLAEDDAASGPAGSDLEVAPLSNDDPSVDPSTFEVVTEPEFGDAVVEGDGTVTYTPAAGFSGVDELVYRVRGGEATVTFTVTPVANDDALTTPADRAGSVDISANDLGDIVEFEIVTGPTHGTAGFTTTDPADLRLHYTPDTGFSGGDRVVYRVTDSSGFTDEATVSVTVTPTSVEQTPPGEQTRPGEQTPPREQTPPARPAPDPSTVDGPLAYTGSPLGILAAAGALLTAAGAGITRFARGRRD